MIPLAVEILEDLWNNRSKVLFVIVVGLLALCKRQHEAITSRDAIIAAKPLVQVQHEVRTVQGPVRIVEKIVTQPGGVRIVERVITREAKTTDSESSRTEVPICAPLKENPQWLLGLGADPLRAQEGVMLRFGTTINNRLDIGYGHSLNGKERNEIFTAIRF